MQENNRSGDLSHTYTVLLKQSVQGFDQRDKTKALLVITR